MAEYKMEGRVKVFYFWSCRRLHGTSIIAGILLRAHSQYHQHPQYTPVSYVFKLMKRHAIPVRTYLESSWLHVSLRLLSLIDSLGHWSNQTIETGTHKILLYTQDSSLIRKNFKILLFYVSITHLIKWPRHDKSKARKLLSNFTLFI